MSWRIVSSVSGLSSFGGLLVILMNGFFNFNKPSSEALNSEFGSTTSVAGIFRRLSVSFIALASVLLISDLSIYVI